jgi:predicted RNA-binding Zn-ribbon protein involved in translation (DUF1610 family)
MPETHALRDEAVCPTCGQPMVLLHVIRRAFAESSNVFRCKPCGFSIIEAAQTTTSRGRR